MRFIIYRIVQKIFGIWEIVWVRKWSRLVLLTFQSLRPYFYPRWRECSLRRVVQIRIFYIRSIICFCRHSITLLGFFPFCILSSGIYLGVTGIARLINLGCYTSYSVTITNIFCWTRAIVQTSISKLNENGQCSYLYYKGQYEIIKKYNTNIQ